MKVYICIVIIYMRISMYKYNYNRHKTNMYVQSAYVYKYFKNVYSAIMKILVRC